MSDPITNRTSSRKVLTFRTVLHCAVVGCAGHMNATGEGFTMIDTTWTHVCPMAFWHRHKWTETHRFFTSDDKRIIDKGSGMSLAEAERIVCGFTTIIDRCAECGELRHYDMTGNAAQQNIKTQEPK